MTNSCLHDPLPAFVNFTQFASDYEFYDYIKLAFEEYQLRHGSFVMRPHETDGQFAYTLSFWIYACSGLGLKP